MKLIPFLAAGVLALSACLSEAKWPMDDDDLPFAASSWSPMDYEGYLYMLIGTEFEAGLSLDFYTYRDTLTAGITVDALYYTSFDDDDEDDWYDEEFDEEEFDEEDAYGEDDEEVDFSALVYLSVTPDVLTYQLGIGASQSYESSGVNPYAEASVGWDNNRSLYAELYAFCELDGIGAGGGVRIGYYHELFWELDLEVEADLSYSEEAEEDVDGYVGISRYLFDVPFDTSAGLGFFLEEDGVGVGFLVEMEL